MRSGARRRMRTADDRPEPAVYPGRAGRRGVAAPVRPAGPPPISPHQRDLRSTRGDNGSGARDGARKGAQDAGSRIANGHALTANTR